MYQQRLEMGCEAKCFPPQGVAVDAECQYGEGRNADHQAHALDASPPVPASLSASECASLRASWNDALTASLCAFFGHQDAECDGEREACDLGQYRHAREEGGQGEHPCAAAFITPSQEGEDGAEGQRRDERFFFDDACLEDNPRQGCVEKCAPIGCG